MAIDQAGLRLSIESTILQLSNTITAMQTAQFRAQYDALAAAWVTRRNTLLGFLTSLTNEQDRLQTVANSLALSPEEQATLPPAEVTELVRQRMLVLAEIDQLQVLVELIVPWVTAAPPAFQGSEPPPVDDPPPGVGTNALFAVDDRIRYIGTSLPSWTGTLGHVVSRRVIAATALWSYNVSLDDGPSLLDVAETDLIAATTPWTAPPPPPDDDADARYDVGDRVRFIAGAGTEYHGQLGRVTKVERISDRWRYSVNLDDGPTLALLYEYELIPATQSWTPPTQTDPFEDFGIGDLVDIDFWLTLFDYIAANTWAALFEIPGQIADAWDDLTSWSSSIYTRVGNVAGDVLLGIDDVIATWANWIKDEITFELPGVGGGIGEAIGLGLGPLADLFKPANVIDILSQARDPISLALSGGISLFFEALEGAIPSAWRELVDEIFPDRDLLPPGLRKMFDWDDLEAVAWAPLIVAAAVGSVTSIMAAGGQALAAPAIWQLNERLTPRLLGQEEVTALRWRIPQLETTWKRDLRRLGIPEDKQDQLASALRPLPGLTLLRDAWFRGALNEDGVHNAIGAWGYTQTAEDIIRAGWPALPQVQDVIRFGVREVYAPDIVRDFNLDANFPDDILADAARVGLAEEEVRKFWRAHWELPSITAAYTMHQRTTDDPIADWSERVENPFGPDFFRIISMERLLQLLRTQDVMQAWRDPVTRVSFRPLNRVDVRRFYRVGVLDEGDVFRAYTDLGYDEANSALQVGFVRGLEQEASFDQLETILGGQAAEGTIELDDVFDALEAFSVPDSVLDAAKTRIAARVNRERTGDVISAFRQAFRFGRISEDDFRDELEDRNLPDATIDHLVDIETIRQGLDFEVFATAETRAAGRTSPMRRFREGLTDDEQFAAEMSALGYGQLDIQRFGQQAVLDADTDLRLDTLTAYRAGLRTGRLSVGEFRQLAGELGVGSDHTDVLILQDELRRALDDPTDEEAELRASGRGTVVTRYREGWIDDEQFAAEMSMLGYSQREIDRYAVEADLRFDLDWKTDLLALLKRQLEVDEISADEYLDQLETLGMEGDRAQTHLARVIAGLRPRIPIVEALPPLPRYLTPTGRVEVRIVVESFRSAQITRSELIARLASLDMPDDLVIATADLEQIRRDQRIAAAVVPEPPAYETDAGKLRLDTARRAFRGGGIAETTFRQALAELAVPLDLAAAIVDAEILRRSAAS
jgi:hypothetical protein